MRGPGDFKSASVIRMASEAWFKTDKYNSFSAMGFSPRSRGLLEGSDAEIASSREPPPCLIGRVVRYNNCAEITKSAGKRMPAGISLKPTPTTRSESRRQAYNTPRKIRCIYYLEMADPLGSVGALCHSRTGIIALLSKPSMSIVPDRESFACFCWLEACIIPVR
jgi:hypothetical protein